FEQGQCATPHPVFAIFRISSSSTQTACANQTSSPSHPSVSIQSIGRSWKRSRVNRSSSNVSHRWVCSRTLFARASIADSFKRSEETEKGEQGASTICNIDRVEAS